MHHDPRGKLLPAAGRDNYWPGVVPIVILILRFARPPPPSEDEELQVPIVETHFAPPVEETHPADAVNGITDIVPVQKFQVLSEPSRYPRLRVTLRTITVTIRPVVSTVPADACVTAKVT